MSGHVKFSYVEAFLQKTIPSIKDAKLITTKSLLRNKPILLTAEKKATKSKPKRSRKKLRVKKRILAKPANSNYASYERLRILWKDYIATLLEDYTTAKTGESKGTLDLRSVQDVLLKADYHGADITVADSPCGSLKGACGTVLQETKNIFLICTKKNKLLRIPKSKAVFTFEHPPGYRITIFGSQFCYKPSHRLTKKFNKNPTMKELLR